MTDNVKKLLVREFTEIVSETNGITLLDTMDLLLSSSLRSKSQQAHDIVYSFKQNINSFMANELPIQTLLSHPFYTVLEDFFKKFPLKYCEEHIHLTGSLTASFIWKRLEPLLKGPKSEIYKNKITEAYGAKAWPIRNQEDVDKLIRLKDTEGFLTYLKVLYLAKLIFTSKEAHSEAAYSMAEDLYHNYNVGSIRLKFSLSRSTGDSVEQIPGIDSVTSEDVVLGLYEGFNQFKTKHPDFKFILSPSFRKEANFFDSSKYKNRKEHFMQQVDEIIELTEKYPFLQESLCEVDTVGDEREMYRKEHFFELQPGFRKLQYKGFKIRSHHGETWHTLKKGIQSVDNAMNIWHIDTLEHGISLGINPNRYFHELYQRVIKQNLEKVPVQKNSTDYKELSELDWSHKPDVLQKLYDGVTLTEKERTQFLKAKFHTAREVEQYQHDVLNRLIQKEVSLVSLPSSNNKLTGKFQDYKDHPFSWWEKKNVKLGVGTDNYITLNTNFIQEMIIILLTDAHNLKITKLLMVTTGENRRPYLSHLLWKMRKNINENI